jgi:hypothetical protein
MRRITLTFILTCSALAQTAQQPQAAKPAPTPPPLIAQRPEFHPENVRPDTVVVEIQGVCSALGDGTAKTSPCATQITRSQFNNMITAIGVPNLATSTAAQKNFAESYAQLLALADAAQKAGIDKDPQFIELMKIAHVRSMGEAYRQFMENKAQNPSQEEIEAFYKQNTPKFEQIRVEKVIVPPVSNRRVAATPADAGKRAKELANQLRERSVKGEDMTILQQEAYKTLSLPAPPNTDMGVRRRGTLPVNLESELFALKPGEVTKVETEPAGFTFYRLRTHDVPSLDSVRNEILRELHQKYVTNTFKAVQDQVHTNLNPDYFIIAPSNRAPATRSLTPGHTSIIPPSSAATPSPTPSPQPKQ